MPRGSFVGLAIAGEGGVASSKPVATAVVGDGGLAVARPVATAIAGIKPSEIGSLGLPIAVNKKLVTKGKYGLVAADQEIPTGLLVGPGFQEARVSQNEIEAEIDDARQQVMGQMSGTLAPNFDTEKFLASLRLKAKQQQAQQQAVAASQQQQQGVFGGFGAQGLMPQSYPFVGDYFGSSQYTAPTYTPSYVPTYYSWNPYQSYQTYQAFPSYQSQLALMAAAYQQQQQQQFAAFQPQYNPYLAVAASPHAFQPQYDYTPQRTYYSAAIAAPASTAATTTAAAATAYPSYYNYPSYSTPSPYRFFYY